MNLHPSRAFGHPFTADSIEMHWETAGKHLSYPMLNIFEIAYKMSELHQS